MTTETLTFPTWVDNPEPRTVPRSECYLVSVPTLFYNDHVWRDLTAGVVERSGKLITKVWLDPEALADLYGDADYFAGFEGEDYEYNRSICDSARTTLRRLRKQIPQEALPTRSVWDV